MHSLSYWLRIGYLNLKTRLSLLYSFEGEPDDYDFHKESQDVFIYELYDKKNIKSVRGNR